MSRPTSVAVLALLIVLNRSVASACSVAFGFHVEPNSYNDWSTSTPEIRAWHYYDRVISFELSELQGRRVPARVIITPIPGVATRSVPFYDWQAFFTTLEPLQPLPAGRYQ